MPAWSCRLLISAHGKFSLRVPVHPTGRHYTSLYASLHLHTRLHYTPGQRSTIDSSISSDARSFFPFLPSASFQRDLALLIDSNGFVDFIRSSKSSIVIESFGKVTQLGGFPRAKHRDELLFNRLKIFSRFTWLLFAIGSFQRSSEYVKGKSAKD